jgi:hypothetical protein
MDIDNSFSIAPKNEHLQPLADKRFIFRPGRNLLTNLPLKGSTSVGIAHRKAFPAACKTPGPAT